MRPYLALIKDSFRAAVASNVLYVLMGVITVLLAVLAPLHVREILDWKIVFGQNVSEPEELAKVLVEKGENKDYPTINHVWGMLRDETRNDVKDWVKLIEEEESKPVEQEEKLNDRQGPRGRGMEEVKARNRLSKDLNDIIKNREFYVESVWEGRRLNPEAKDLVKLGVTSLSTERSRRLNRLLMASTFPRIIRRGNSTALNLKYAIWGEDWTFSMSHSQFSQTTTAIVTWVFDKFVLSVGLFIAILVTANFIPETFHPGSLNLLLSKPISRWGLLLSKYAGGCAFVSLCAVYLFLGLWLWLGLAMGIWDISILWGIPLYVIVFAIYYSVSTLVGLWSRSAILAIIMTALFWAACFGVGSAYNVMANRMDNSKLSNLVPVKDKVLQVGEMDAVSKWSDSENKWVKALEIEMMDEQRAAMGFVLFAPNDEERNGAGKFGQQRLGPVFDPKSEQVIAGMFDLSKPSSMRTQNLFASKSDSINFKKIGRMPTGTIALLPDKKGIIAVQDTGKFYRYSGPETLTVASDKGPTKKTTMGWIGSQIDSMIKTKTPSKGPFIEAGPKESKSISRNPHRVCLNYQTGEIFSYKEAKITRFAVRGEEGKYAKISETEIETGANDQMRCVIRAAGDSVVLALGNGKIIVLDAATLKERKSYLPQKQSPFREVRASNNGRFFAFMCRNGKVWLLDNEKPDAIVRANISGQGTVSAIQFDAENRLWVANNNINAQLYNLEDSAQLESHAPSAGILSTIFYYGINPFYKLCPKPGEFYKVISHLSAKSNIEATEGASDIELDTLTDTPDPWQPLWSGLLFMMTMLIIAGLIFQFRDY